MANGVQPRLHQNGPNAVHLRREVNEGTGIKVLRITAIVVSILATIVSWIVLPWGIALGVTGAAALAALCCCCCRNRRVERIENPLPRFVAAQEVPVAAAPVFVQEPVVVLPAPRPLPARRFHWFPRREAVVDPRPRELVADPHPRIVLPQRRIPDPRPREAVVPRHREMPPIPAINPLPPRNVAPVIDPRPREAVAAPHLNRERPHILAANPIRPRNVAAGVDARPREAVAAPRHREMPQIPAVNPIPPRNMIHFPAAPGGRLGGGERELVNPRR